MISEIAKDKRMKLKVMMAVQSAIIDTFDASDWCDLADRSGFRDQVRKHNRLLRSLDFGDSDYEGHAGDMIRKILDEDFLNIEYVICHKKIRDHILKHDSSVAIALDINDDNSDIASLSLQVTSSPLVRLALKDAEVLIASGRISSAVDRVHTAIHGYMQHLCKQAGVLSAEGAKFTELYKLVRSRHPAFTRKEACEVQMDSIMKALASVLDTINYIRNNMSLAHPNEVLLKESEAKLAINASSAILHYMSQRVADHEG